MKTRELNNIGIPKGEALNLALEAIKTLAQTEKLKNAALRERMRAVAGDPAAFLNDAILGKLARKLAEMPPSEKYYAPRETGAPWRQWGENLDGAAIAQMGNACRLPVAMRGALMPDAHTGYGLPIGGVLATENAVVPYAVGVDIACRMKLTVLDLPTAFLNEATGRLRRAIEDETRFGVGSNFPKNARRSHEVMDEDWSLTTVTGQHKDKAWAQLGTSGSGNHFVEFGQLTVTAPGLGLDEGRYLALLSHSGSRGTGAAVCNHYSRVARQIRAGLPKEMAHLAWLALDSEAGREYWAAMQLMGRYAAANHVLIHRHIAAHLGAEILLDIENHHNFAWREKHDGREVIVHRKGATPASAGALGVIPGSMATPGYIVRGLGAPGALDSASHGAGRRMSRKAAKAQFDWKTVQEFLKNRGVELMSAGLDECPMAYKDIGEVMAAQQDLVEILARFQPRLVKMAPSGERPED